MGKHAHRSPLDEGRQIPRRGRVIERGKHGTERPTHKTRRHQHVVDNDDWEKYISQSYKEAVDVFVNTEMPFKDFVLIVRFLLEVSYVKGIESVSNNK